MSVGRLLRLMGVLGIVIALVVGARTSRSTPSTTMRVGLSQATPSATSCQAEEHQEALRLHAARVAADNEDVAEHGQPESVAEDNAEKAAEAAALQAEIREDEAEATGYGACH